GKARISVGVARVRRSCQQHHVPLWAAGKRVEQIEPLLLTPSARADTGMGLVYDDEVRTFECKIVAALIGLYEIEAYNGEGVDIEGLGTEGKPALVFAGRSRSDGDGVDPDLSGKLGHPLVNQVGGAHDGKAADFAAVDHLTGNKTRLDCLTDADVVCDEE